MLHTVTLVSLVVAFAAVILLVRSVRAVARRREQVDTLMRRIAELEERLTYENEAGADASSPGDVRQVEEEPLSADVLAGWTSHVDRMLAEETTPEALADRAVVTIYQHIDEPIQPSALADELNVSLRTLERGLARGLDCSPGQLILAVKMREARRMLASGRLQVSQVAHRLAFTDAAYFARRYKRFYRCPPSRHLAGSASVAESEAVQ